MFAGSVFGLESGKTYECSFEMSDPDGVRGSATQTVKVTTRTYPKTYSEGRVLHVYPPNYEVLEKSLRSPVCSRPITGRVLAIGMSSGRVQ